MIYHVQIFSYALVVSILKWSVTDDDLFIFQVRDQNIVAMCKEMGIAVTHEHSHTLYNLDK